MQPLRVPPRLRERLGNDESDDLALLLQTASSGWRNDVLTLAPDRFGQVLATEAGRLRVEMFNGDAAIRHELVETRAMFRQELAETRAALREDMSALRVEVLRWSFLFWLGQIATIAALLSYYR
ncbi:MAG: hypothetical protein H0X44_04230 [Acidobacteria bacterium]|nr:hypothetical protein [Acidobacteriota bacterium]